MQACWARIPDFYCLIDYRWRMGAAISVDTPTLSCQDRMTTGHGLLEARI